MDVDPPQVRAAARFGQDERAIEQPWPGVVLGAESHGALRLEAKTKRPVRVEDVDPLIRAAIGALDGDNHFASAIAVEIVEGNRGGDMDAVCLNARQFLDLEVELMRPEGSARRVRDRQR